MDRVLTVSLGVGAPFSECPWSQLDAASLLCIYRKLDSRDAASASCVCRHWRDVGQTRSLWRDLLIREVGCPLKRYDLSSVQENYRQMLVDAKTARLWSWGANMLKLAGISADSITLPTEVFLHAIEVGPSVSGIAFSAESHAELRNLPAREVSCAEDFAVILTWEGQVIDSRGSLANNAPWRHQGRLLDSLNSWPFKENQAVAVAAGGTWSGHGASGGHAAAITADGGLWVWGGNGVGQLGLGLETDAWISSPRRVTKLGWDKVPAPAAAVACGSTHTLVALADGTLWAAGSNYKGACGLPEEVKEVWEFVQVDLTGRRVAQLAAGDFNSAVLTDDGRVMACGSNSNAQCGMHSSIPCIHAFVDLGPHPGWHGAARSTSSKFQVTGVACGSECMYALVDGGSAFAWGGGASGELGIGAVTRAVATPSRMLWAHDVELVTGSAGGKFGAAVDAHGRLFTFGNGRAGQLGQGDTSKRSVGRIVKTLQPVVVRRAAAGACFSMAISSWRCPSSVSPPETPEPSVPAPFSCQDPAAPVWHNREGEPGVTLFTSLSLRTRGPGHQHSLRRNSSGTSWNSTDSEGHSMFSSSPGEMSEDDEDDEDFMAEDAPDAGLGRFVRSPSLPHHASSFPGASSRLGAALGQPLGGATGSAQNLASASTSTDKQQESSNDRQLRRDLRRQLRAFMQDSSKRELLFPFTLTSGERHQVHVVAEAWGLAHQSRGMGGERQLVVWKPSKSIRRTSSMLAVQAEFAPPLLERDEEREAMMGIVAHA